MQGILLLGAPTLLIAGLAWPMLFTNDVVNGDWTHHLWLVWNQSLALRANYLPSFFLDYSHAVFYPIYAFYGGTAYAAAGATSLLLGDAPVLTYVLTYVLGFAAAYGGWYWISRTAGLGRWRAHAPGVIFITSAYYLTLIYSRGDWTEFLAVSMIPLVIASALSVLCAEERRLWPSLALIFSTVFFGNHNLTLVWGATSMVLVAVLVIVCVPAARRKLTRRGVARVACLALPAMLVNAWFLLPAAAYQVHTSIGSRYPYWRLVLRGYMFVVSAGHLFALTRGAAVPWIGTFIVTLPVLAIVWVLIGLVLFSLRDLRATWTRVLLICAALSVAMTITMTHAALILALPRPYATLQYSHRLDSYVLLGISGAVLALLASRQRGGLPRRIWMWSLVPIAIASVVAGIAQTSGYEAGGDRSSVLITSTRPRPLEPGTFDYGDATLTEFLARREQPQEVDFPIAAARHDHVSITVHLPPGRLVYTNLGGGPELVQVTGAKIVGITPRHDDVMEIGPSTGGARGTSPGRHGYRWTEVISVRPASGLPVVLGRVLSLAAIVVLVGQCLALVARNAHIGGGRRGRLAAD